MHAGCKVPLFGVVSSRSADLVTEFVRDPRCCVLYCICQQSTWLSATSDLRILRAWHRRVVWSNKPRRHLRPLTKHTCAAVSTPIIALSASREHKHGSCRSETRHVVAEVPKSQHRTSARAPPSTHRPGGRTHRSPQSIGCNSSKGHN